MALGETFSRHRLALLQSAALTKILINWVNNCSKGPNALT